MDDEQLLNGGFKPLCTFMNFEDLDGVLKKWWYPSGEIWSIPILFPKSTDQIISCGTTLIRKAIKNKSKVSDIYIRKEVLAELQNMRNAFN